MPHELKEYRLTVSCAQSLNMSIDEVEEKFNMGQLVLMSIMQKISSEEDEKERKNTSRSRPPVNKGKTIDERNRDAFNRL